MLSPSENSPVNPNLLGLSPALMQAVGSIATVVVDALEAPLRAEIESRIQMIVADATKDIHARIAAAVGQIQPIAIPIHLFTQPTVQMVAPAPVPMPVVAPVPASVLRGQPLEVLPPDTQEQPDEEEDDRIHDVENLDESQDWAPPAVVQQAETTPAPTARPAVPTPKLDKKKNLKVTVVGLLPGQAHMIKNEFKFVRLTFIAEKSGNSSQLISLSKSNDLVIFMTDFIRHASVETVRSANGNWIYVSGGMTTLREKLRELHQEHQKQTAGWAGLIPV